jgi:hypothetical protein
MLYFIFEENKKKIIELIHYQSYEKVAYAIKIVQCYPRHVFCAHGQQCSNR